MSISQYILNPNEQRRLYFQLRNKWMIRFRWYYIGLLSVVAIGPTLLIGNRGLVHSYSVISAFAIIANLLLWLTAALSNKGSISYFRFIAICQIMVDLALASSVIYLQGGLTSRATLLYALPILVAGVLFMGWFAYVAGLLSGITYTATLLITTSHNSSLTLRDTIVPAAFYSSVFLLLAAIISRMTELNAFAERKKSYSELLSLLRHELHQPVGVTAAIIEMIEHSNVFSQMSGADRRLIHQLKYENRRMHTMITNLLAAGTQLGQAKKIEKVNLVVLLEEAAVSCATVAKRLEDLDSRYSGEPVTVLGSYEQLTTAINNIIDNAFRYSKSGERVKIELEPTPSLVNIIVTDQGEGMTASQQRQLFERFTKFEQDNTSEETVDRLNTLGLGLYVSKLIIEQHGGHLAVESERGKGTKITLTLNKEAS